MDREGERKKNILYFSRKACQLLKKHRKSFYFLFCFLPISYPVFSHFSGGPQVVHTSSNTFFNIFKEPGAFKLKKTFWGWGNGVTFYRLLFSGDIVLDGMGSGGGGGSGLGVNGAHMALPCLGALHTLGIPSNCLYMRWTGKERGERISCIFLGKLANFSRNTEKGFGFFVTYQSYTLYFLIFQGGPK
jgi:hypothetical protein